MASKTYEGVYRDPLGSSSTDDKNFVIRYGDGTANDAPVFVPSLASAGARLMAKQGADVFKSFDLVVTGSGGYRMLLNVS